MDSTEGSMKWMIVPCRIVDFRSSGDRTVRHVPHVQTTPTPNPQPPPTNEPPARRASTATTPKRRLTLAEAVIPNHHFSDAGFFPSTNGPSIDSDSRVLLHVVVATFAGLQAMRQAVHMLAPLPTKTLCIVSEHVLPFLNGCDNLWR